jgi:hypothetical protein
MSRSTPVVGSVPERHNPDGTFVGEPEVRVRCADCHAPAWIRVSEVEKARCPACHDAFEAQYRPELTAVDGDGEPAELLPPVLELIPGEAP